MKSFYIIYRPPGSDNRNSDCIGYHLIGGVQLYPFTFPFKIIEDYFSISCFGTNVPLHNARMLMQMHDELVLEVPEDEADRVSNIVRQEMEDVYP